MLVEFRVSNFRSFAEEQILSLVPASNQHEFKDNIIKRGKHQALNVLAVYGANGSGKSNLVKAFHHLAYLVRESAGGQSTTILPYQPNLLIAGYSEKPTTLDVVFYIGEIRYRYGCSFDKTDILTEYLYRKAVGREVNLFVREKDIIDVSSGLKGGTKIIDATIEATRDNALFLSFGDMFNISELQKVFGWFASSILVDGLNTNMQGRTTESFIKEQPEFLDEINNFITVMDFGFERLILSEANKNGEQAILAAHQTFNPDGSLTKNIVAWPLTLGESAGTNKMFELIGPVIAALKVGGLIIVDEIAAKLHTHLTEALVEIFLNKKTNPNDAQMVFATHDTNLLTRTEIRRDQIYFLEKNGKQATELFSLADFRYFKGNKERPDVDKEKRYLEGRYGATPKVKLKEVSLAQ